MFQRRRCWQNRGSIGLPRDVVEIRMHEKYEIVWIIDIWLLDSNTIAAVGMDKCLV